MAFLAATIGLCPVSLAEEPAESAGSLASRVREDTQWFAGYPSRTIGQPGHDEAFDELYHRVEAVAGQNVWRHRVPFVVPQVLEATLTIEGGPPSGKHRIYPFWPAGPRLNTTPVRGISGRLVYVGQATIEELPAESLRGQIAVIEMTNGWKWRHALAFGARAVIFLGSRNETHRDMRSHDMVIPLKVPRFYLPDGELADSLRNKEIKTGHIYSEGRWRKTTGQNIYALVPSRDPQTPRKAIAIVVQSDSMCMIPELARGADSAVDTALALNLMRYFLVHPAEHPLLFAFIDGFALNMKGLRYMLGALKLTPEIREKNSRGLKSVLDDYREYADLVLALRDDPQGVFKVHQPAYRDLRQFIKDEASQEALTAENRLEPLRLEVYGLAEEDTVERRQIEETIARLEDRRAAYNTASKQMLEGPGQVFVNRIRSWVGAGGQSVSADGLMEIEDHAIGNAKKLWQRAQVRILGQVADLEEIFEEDRLRDRMQSEIFRALNLAPDEEGPLLFVLGIDLSDAGIAVGVNTAGKMVHTEGGAHATQFIDWLMTVDWTEVGNSLPPGTLHALDVVSWESGDSQNSFTVGEHAIVTGIVADSGIPSMSWTTNDGYRAKVDTPQDHPDRLDWQRLVPQIDLTAEVVRRIAGDSDFQPMMSPPRKRGFITARVVGQASGEPIARLPQRDYLGSLITGYAGSGQYSSYWWTHGRVGMRRQEFFYPGWDGYFHIRDMWVNSWYELAKVSLQAHRLAEDGSIIGAIDLNSERLEGGFNTHLWSSEQRRPLSGTVFPCMEMNAFHLYDPRTISEMGTTITDARTGTVPKRLNYGSWNGIISGLMEPRVWWQIVSRIGVTDNRLMLLNMHERVLDPGVRIAEASAGFAMDQPLLDRHTAHQAAHDMYLLDERRLADYRRAGIHSEAITKMRDRTKRLLVEADEAMAADDGSRLFHSAAGAVANEVRAYRAVRDLGNDVVRAVVFLLLGLIPFSFALERLLFSSPNPYRQMGYVGGIFATMLALLWSFHPAFRITSQPLIIVMAFGIILLSVTVTLVIFYRFKSNVEEMKSEFAESSGAQTSRLGLISTAVKLGLANMRKRKLRTGLTGATIVFITFAMLCFTSTTTYIGEKDLATEIEMAPPYAGVLFRWPSQGQIDRRAETYLNNIIANTDLSGLSAPAGNPAIDPVQAVTYRYWWALEWNRNWRIHVKSPDTGRQVSMKAGIGLQDNEDRFTGIHRVLPNWARFASLERTYESTQRGGCYVALEVAESLGVKPGDTLVIGGRSMELVGTYDPDRLQAVTDLDGQNLMVLDYAAMPDTQKVLATVGRKGDWSLLTNAEGLAWQENLPRIKASQTVILPASFLRLYGLNYGSGLRSMAVRTDSTETARAIAVETGQRMAFPAYYGSAKTGTRILVFVPYFPTPPRSLWILMTLAGLIIFNTMMSSIAERKNEIYIYTSMGLAPMHIGVLFLAEAVTYGLMGSLFGYVAGQGLATLLGHLGWLGGLSLNYSGTHAIFTMLMVVCITIVSSIIPAYRAGRLAVPSNRMYWSVPAPRDGVISDKLPFTVTDRTANGTLLYLHDYLDAHRDGAIGCFITDAMSLTPMTLRNAGNADRELTVIRPQATVSLAPYDLGVRQDAEIRIAPTDDPEILEIGVSLRHVSGQVDNWVRLNKTFLGDLRRQLLGWRNLRTRRMLRYIAEAGERLTSMTGKMEQAESG